MSHINAKGPKQEDQTRPSNGGPESKLDLSLVKATAGLKGLLASYTFENWKAGIQPNARAAALSFFEEPRSFVFWSEIYGSGKTFAACAILDFWLLKDQGRVDPRTGMPVYVGGHQPFPTSRQHIGGLFVPTGDLLARIRATYSRTDGETESDIVTELQKTPLLVLDDVGYEEITAHARAILYRIINARYAAGLHIIITTNRSVEHLLNGQDGLGGASVSRLRQMGDFVHLMERDYRGSEKTTTHISNAPSLRPS